METAAADLAMIQTQKGTAEFWAKASAAKVFVNIVRPDAETVADRVVWSVLQDV